jgi:hypothetical protein
MERLGLSWSEKMIWKIWHETWLASLKTTQTSWMPGDVIYRGSGKLGDGLSFGVWGSKGVAFLATLNIQDEIEYAVDINPYKQGTYIAGTGQEIVAPKFLRGYRPDVVIVMNPIYCNEIQQDLDRMGVTAELVPV